MSKGHIHILGIAGHAMRGVALAAKELGYEVTGTDETAYEPGTTWLADHGITLYQEADARHLDGVIELIIGGGVSVVHPELVAAKEKGIPVRSYPELVNYLAGDARRIVVTGTHGKTTTTSLIAWVLESAGKRPDFLVGIQPKNFDSSVRLAGGKVVVIEGDEYRSSQLDDRSKFFYYKPNVAVITSIEHDHPDLFPDLASVVDRFEGLVSEMPADGRLIFCNNSDVIRSVAAKSKAPIESYSESADWEPKNVEFGPDGISFDLHHKEENLGRLEVPLYGEHNVLNATAAAAVALGEGLSFEELQEGFKSFKGAARRFEKVSKKDAKVTVVDDYAHHPTEVATTIDAVRRHFPMSRVVAVFRPHTYSRTLGLLEEYKRAFEDANVAFITDIEGAREAGLEGKVSGEDIAVAAHVQYVPQREKLVEAVLNEAKEGDVVLCMTVNGYGKLAEELADKLG